MTVAVGCVAAGFEMIVAVGVKVVDVPGADERKTTRCPPGLEAVPAPACTIRTPGGNDVPGANTILGVPPPNPPFNAEAGIVIVLVLPILQLEFHQF